MVCSPKWKSYKKTTTNKIKSIQLEKKAVEIVYKKEEKKSYENK